MCNVCIQLICIYKDFIQYIHIFIMYISILIYMNLIGKIYIFWGLNTTTPTLCNLSRFGVGSTSQSFRKWSLDMTVLGSGSLQVSDERTRVSSQHQSLNSTRIQKSYPA